MSHITMLGSVFVTYQCTNVPFTLLNNAILCITYILFEMLPIYFCNPCNLCMVVINLTLKCNNSYLNNYHVISYDL